MPPTFPSPLDLGSPAPDFELIDVRTGHLVSRDLAAREASGFLVVFMCAHCPYVVHVEEALAALLRAMAPRGLRGVAISSNNVATHPDDRPARLAAQAERIDLPVAYLYDESQGVAQAYGARCTPDFFLFDRDLKLAYRGRFDATRPGGGAAAHGDELRAAIEAVLEGRAAPQPQHPSIGCGIKWKPGNEPS